MSDYGFDDWLQWRMDAQAAAYRRRRLAVVRAAARRRRQAWGYVLTVKGRAAVGR